MFAAITEGTQGEGVTSHLPVLIPELTETMKCADVNLRVAAMEAMCMMATHCQPEMADEYAGTAFSLIASMLTHAPRSCQWAVHSALSKMCENSLGEGNRAAYGAAHRGFKGADDGPFLAYRRARDAFIWCSGAMLS